MVIESSTSDFTVHSVPQLSRGIVDTIMNNLELFKNIPPDLTIREVLSSAKEAYEYYDEVDCPPIDPSVSEQLRADFGKPFENGVTFDAIKETCDCAGTGEDISNAFRSLGELNFWQQGEAAAFILNHHMTRRVMGERLSVEYDEVEEVLTIKSGPFLLTTLESADICQEVLDLLEPGLGKPQSIVTLEGTPLVSRATGVVDPLIQMEALDKGDLSTYKSLLSLPKEAKRLILRRVYENDGLYDSHFTGRVTGTSVILSYKGADLVSFRAADQPWLRKKPGAISAESRRRARALDKARAENLLKGFKSTSRYFEILPQECLQ
jgi:hypothetical protein